MDKLTPEQRHRNMASVKNRNTDIEVMLCKALWHKGVRYRKNFKVLDCKPDIVITKHKIAVFCDGEFWHGRDLGICDAKTNAVFWNQKIRRNMERDLENTIMLRDNGWRVLRFWDSEIKKDLAGCVEAVLSEIRRD